RSALPESALVPKPGYSRREKCRDPDVRCRMYLPIDSNNTELANGRRQHDAHKAHLLRGGKSCSMRCADYCSLSSSSRKRGIYSPNSLRLCNGSGSSVALSVL